MTGHVEAVPASVQWDSIWLRWVFNPRVYGNWHNWLSMARTLCELAEERGEKYVLTSEDDVEYSPQAIPEAEAILEKLLAEGGGVGFLGLYTNSVYQQYGQGIFCLSKKQLWKLSVGMDGACALAWPVASLRKVIECPTALTWRGAELFPYPEGDPKTAHADTCIGHCCNDLGLKMYWMNPGLAQHVGEISSIRDVPLTEKRQSQCVR